MSERSGKIARMISLVKAPGIWEFVLGGYAALCVLYLYIGFERFLRDTDWGGAAVSGWLVLCVVVPYTFFVWGRRKPTKAIARDFRVWLLAPVALLGIGMAITGVSVAKALDTLAMIFFLPAVFAACVWIYLRMRFRQAGALAKAQKTGWRLSEKEEADLGVEEAILDEMTPRQRLRHNLIIMSGFVAFPVVIIVLLLFKASMLITSVVAVQIFVINSAALISYYGYLLRRQLVQRKRSAIELEAARRMQMSLMPTSDPEVPGFEIAGLTLPAEEVGGDLFAYMQLDGRGNAFGIAVADVSGKAMKAAIATVLVSGMLKLESGRAGLTSEIMANINRALVGSIDSFMFVAMQVLVLDPSTGKLSYCNAGQVHPLLLKSGSLSSVEQNALPLGIVQAAQFDALELSMGSGDLLFLVSDGITEAMNERREIFGSEKLERTLLSLDPKKPVRALLEDVISAVEAFRGKTPPSDDRTIVVIKKA